MPLNLNPTSNKIHQFLKRPSLIQRSNTRANRGLGGAAISDDLNLI